MLTLEQKLCIIVYVGLPSDASTISMAQDKKSDDFNMAPWSSGQDTTLSRWYQGFDSPRSHHKTYVGA